MENNKNNMVEAPITTIDTNDKENPIIIIHNYINIKGKMVINKSEAALLYLELHKFLND